MTFKKNLITAIATGAVLLNAIAPIAFADTIAVTGNGEQSTNSVTAASTSNTSVNQQNSTTVNNTVNSNANTGGNTAYSNTGGSVFLGSGNASSSTDISNKAGLNSATVSCNCASGTGTNVNVAGNGEFSNNTATVANTKTTTLNQGNSTTFNNNVNTNANSGNNLVAGNTGSYLGGSTFGVVSGSANASTSIDNRAGANFANVGSSNGGAGNGSSVAIVGNGEKSNNSVVLAGYNSVSLGQNNSTNIGNNVNTNANSGGNIAYSNTGGSVLVGSGEANASTDIMNSAGFNQASVDCGCLTSGLNVLLGGNGEFSHNSVTAVPSHVLGVSQGNGANLNNNANSNATSGGSNASGNTGAYLGGSTTQVFSGSANQSTDVSNAGGVNIFGNSSFTLPTWITGGSNVSTTFDMTGFWAMWTGMFHV